MKSYEIYNLILCLIVFVSLTALFCYLIGTIIRLTLSVIRNGLHDEKIKEEYLKKKQNKKQTYVSKILDMAFSVSVLVVLFVVLCFSLYSRFTDDQRIGIIPTVKVVESGSMESKNPTNRYLFDNALDNQVEVFDLILLHKLPPEDELRLYDIVVYESNGYCILHRIVGIEEPNANHPDDKWFLLQGDANRLADDFPVTYEQMRSIYRNERIPFVGSFVSFMQSPAGMLCFLLVVFAIFASQISEKKLGEAKAERIKILFPEENQENEESDNDGGNEEQSVQTE